MLATLLATLQSTPPPPLAPTLTMKALGVMAVGVQRQLQQLQQQ